MDMQSISGLEEELEFHCKVEQIEQIEQAHVLIRIECQRGRNEVERDMRGKTILVTGAASGIGAQTAKLLSEQGAVVIGFDLQRPKEHIDQFVAVDLSDPPSIQAAVAQVGRIDGLCNVAGVPPTRGRTLVLRVNVLGLRMLTEQVVAKMSDGAAIVNVASLAGCGWADRLPAIRSFLAMSDFSEVDAFCERHGITDESCYAFSKEALIVWNLTNWNKWLDRGIRMNCVSPGPVETPILSDFRATIGKRFQDSASRLDKRAAIPGDIASVIAFLCSDASRWIRGANIPVDGGMAALVTATGFGP